MFLQHNDCTNALQFEPDGAPEPDEAPVYNLLQASLRKTNVPPESAKHEATKRIQCLMVRDISCLTMKWILLQTHQYAKQCRVDRNVSAQMLEAGFHFRDDVPIQRKLT